MGYDRHRQQARQEMAIQRDRIGQLTEIVSMQGEHILELEARLKDQAEWPEISLIDGGHVR
jgi:hypothetical protein